MGWNRIKQATMYSVSLRKATLSFHNIKQTEAFTINIPSEKYLKEADFVGIVSVKEYDKFKKTGLTPDNIPFPKILSPHKACHVNNQTWLTDSQSFKHLTEKPSDLPPVLWSTLSRV